MFKPEIRQTAILVADDLEAYRCLLTDLLEDKGYKVICAGDGDEALTSNGYAAWPGGDSPKYAASS